MKPITEGKTGLYVDDAIEKVIRFDTVVSVVEGPGHALPRTIGMRKMSLPLSFARTPTKEDLNDPSFIPTPTRKLSLRLPSLKASHPPTSPAVGSIPPPPLRSCLQRSSLSTHNHLGRTSSSTGNHEIPSLSSAAPFLATSLPLQRVQSPSSFIHSPFRRNSATSPVASSSNVTSFIDENHGPVETLTECCPECQKSVELGFQSSWEDAPWSQAALKKRERDEKDRLEQDKEFGPLEGGRGVVGVGQRNGCVTPNGVSCDDIDGGQIEGFIERVKGVLVDEVSMVRRATQVLKEEEEAEDDAGSDASPVALVPSSSRCPFTSRNSSSSLLAADEHPTTATPKSSPTMTTAAFPSTSSPSQQRVSRRSPGVDLHVPLPSSTTFSPASPISSTLETPVWILGDGSSYDMASRNPMDSPSSTLFPPSPLSLDESPSSSPSAAAEKEPYFPRVSSPSTTSTPPPTSYNPPLSPPLSNDHGSSSTPTLAPSSPTATITPSSQKPPTLPTPISPFVVLPVASPRPERARAQSQSTTMGGSNAPSPSPPQPHRSSSVPRRRTASPLEVKEAPAAPMGGVQKIKGMWGMLKGLQIGAAGAGVRGF
ncbi:hypothetical protein BDY24DRAFT_369807 [Mrakia frigida]|uniref:uncharacterized protein n=1 Tax=Mrakia frigida TaxID=29902 RepID=UPI003FCBEF59